MGGEEKGRGGEGEIRNLQEELEAQTDDQRIVAELLDVPVEDLELVENRGYS